MVYRHNELAGIETAMVQLLHQAAGQRGHMFRRNAVGTTTDQSSSA